MASIPSTSGAAKRPLRETRRDFTRRHVCLAANELFVRNGFAQTTMEEIARVTGIQRSTLYNHYREKEAVLAEIAAGYIVKVQAIIALLNGPTPTYQEIMIWIQNFARFVIEEPGPAELIMAVGLSHTPLAVSVEFGERMMVSFAERLPAFAKALAPDEGFVRAWANATLSDLGMALTYHARDPMAPSASDRLKVAAMLFSRFVSGQSGSADLATDIRG